jgi:hypothetical protein
MRPVSRGMLQAMCVSQTLALLLLIGATVPANGQIDSLSGPMLRRLAEAADGYRTGRPIFFAVSTTPPHVVLGSFSNRDSARAFATRMSTPGRRVGAFGPFITPADSTAVRVTRVLVVVRGATRTDTITVDPFSLDAIFWSLPSLDKFCIPHYAMIYGPAFADSVRTALRGQMNSRGFVGHWLGTFCGDDDLGHRLP